MGSYYRLPWWRPDFPVRFLANSAYWLKNFLMEEPAVRRSLVRRKLQNTARQIRRWFGLRTHPAPIDVEEVLDTSLFPPEELKIWQLHLRALAHHRPRQYAGPVTLIRTRGHPFFCSFDPQNGWGELAAGGVEVIVTPGAHVRIFHDPHVRELAARLQGCLDRRPAAANRGEGEGERERAGREGWPAGGPPPGRFTAPVLADCTAAARCDDRTARAPRAADSTPGPVGHCR
jgi:hypothetical protein